MGARPRWPVLLAVALSLTAASARAQDLAAAVKATYLYKLGPFVSWPPGALPPGAEPLVICVQAQDSFAALAERAAAGQQIGGHPLKVRRIARLERGSGCHVAMLAGSPAQPAAAALAAAQGLPVLTVTDAAQGPARGIVHLVPDNGRVRFAIDARKAQAAGLGISSKLLALAVEVSR